MLEFNEETHQYSKNGKDYISVTQLLDKIKEPFDADTIIDKMLKGQEIYLGTKSEILGLNKEQIKQLWDLNRIGKSNYGSYIHNLAEEVAKTNISNSDRPENKQVLKFFKNEGYKLVEAEKQVYSEEFGIAGTMDLLLEKDGKYYIADWKTNLNTDLTKFEGDRWTKHLLEPLDNVLDLKYWIYALQMSIYRYIMENEVQYMVGIGETPHFESLEFGGQFIIHLQESQKNCPYDMKQITYKLIETPYMKTEVERLLQWWKK